jgi:ApaG protein
MTSQQTYECVVTVKTQYLADQSNIDASQYVFSYTIQITNTGKMAAQLISRHWVITDANNKVQEVRGLGVVGDQPLLEPGASYEYTSGTMLNTPVGTMHGTYQFTAVDGTQFDVEIPTFTLAMPRVLH